MKISTLLLSASLLATLPVSGGTTPASGSKVPLSPSTGVASPEYLKSVSSVIRMIISNPAPTPQDVRLLDLRLADYRFLRETAGDLGKVVSDPGGKAFVDRLLDNPASLNDYLDTTFFTDASKERADGLLAWARIDKAYPESRDGTWRRVAAALAVVFGKERSVNESVWGQSVSRPIDPVARYGFFRASAERGQLVPYFFNAPAWELAFVVHGGYRPLDELLWAQQMTPPDRLTQRGAASLAYAPVHYRSFNYRDDSVQHFGSYYDGKPGGLTRMADYGAVCGGISTTGAIVATTHGVPAFTIGQPGHCAYVYKGSPSTWDGGNFVSGWRDSNGASQVKFWAAEKSVNVRLLTKAYTHPQFRDALRQLRLAEVFSDSGDDKEALRRLDLAVKLCPSLYPAQAERLALLKRTGAPAMTLAKACVDATRDLAEFPAAGATLRDGCETAFLAKGLSLRERAAYLDAIAGAIVSTPASRQQGLDVAAFTGTFTRQLAVFGLKPRDIGTAITPKKVKKGETPPPPVVLKTPKNTGELVAYLDAVAPAANRRAAFAEAVKSVVNALPEDVRSKVALKLAPPAEETKPRYDAKHFAKIGDWTVASVAAAPVITVGWRELEFVVPENLRKSGRLVVAVVRTTGDNPVIENLRLYADGAEVDADTSSVEAKPRRPGLFTLDLDAAHTRARRITLRALIADNGKTAPESAGEIGICP